jgi:hypothetical protein
MAQSGYTPISLYYSTVSGRAPSAANLAQGELAINTTDGVLYYKNASGNVVPLTSAGGASAWEPVQTANFTAVAGQSYPINTTSGSITVTLPASPTVGQVVGILDYAGTFGTNSLLIANNGSKINGAAVEVIVTTNREALTFGYVDSTQGWIIFQSFLGTVPLPANYNASYLVVAGGGGGGNPNFSGSGGGGAGGYLTGCKTLSPGTVYSVTIGAGGGANGMGSNSFALCTTSTGGGAGAGTGGTGVINGGSGGGKNVLDCAGQEIGPGSGIAGQGYGGGIGSGYVGGGGGGASQSGQGTSGGSGLASYITGTGTYFAGGGGGGNRQVGNGGTGGNGGGGNASASPSGATNTGGGGAGGGTDPNAYGPGGGGSGIVILSVPTSRYTGTTTGSPTITINGSNTVMKFTSSGSYTA